MRKLLSNFASFFLGPERAYITEFYYYDRNGNLRLDTERAIQSDWYKKQMEAARKLAKESKYQ